LAGLIYSHVFDRDAAEGDRTGAAAPREAYFAEDTLNSEVCREHSSSPHRCDVRLCRGRANAPLAFAGALQAFHPRSIPQVRLDSGSVGNHTNSTADGRWESPTPSFAHAFSAAIYDSLRYRMLSFGGNGAGFINSVYELRLSGDGAWTEVPASGTRPSPRTYASAIYDPVRDRLIVFGGMTSDYADLNDVWALSLEDASWHALEPLGDAPTRTLHSAVYDPVQDRMIVFGGENYDASTRSDTSSSEVWALSLSDPPQWARSMLARARLRAI